MKKIHQFTLLVMTALLFAASLTTSAFAAKIENSEILKFEDGSYIIVTIEYDQTQNGISYLTGRSVTSGTKKYTYYDGSDTLAWEFRVHGSFAYNGMTATATGSSYS